MMLCDVQWRSQPKNLGGAKKFGGPKCLILSELRYFVWKNASQSTKRLYFLTIWGVMAPLDPLATPIVTLHHKKHTEGIRFATGSFMQSS